MHFSVHVSLLIINVAHSIFLSFQLNQIKKLTLGRGASADRVLAEKIPYIPAPAGAATSQNKKNVSFNKLGKQLSQS